MERCRELGVLVHVDAAQAVGHERVAFTDLGADLLSLSGHKFGAPPGTGALLVRRGLRLEPLLVGGDQERARRAGMENVPAVVGMGAAAEELAGTLGSEVDHQRRLTDRVLEWARSADGVRVLGDPVDRVGHLVCLGLDGIEPQPVLLGLDQAGVAVHSGQLLQHRGARAVPGAAGDGGRRRPLVAHLGRLELDRRRCRPPARRTPRGPRPPERLRS